MISVTLFKIGKRSDFYLSFFLIVGAWRDLTVATKLIKKIKKCTAKKCTKNYNARAQPLFCSLNLLLTNFPVAVVVFVGAVYTDPDIFESATFSSRIPKSPTSYRILCGSI